MELIITVNTEQAATLQRMLDEGKNLPAGQTSLSALAESIVADRLKIIAADFKRRDADWAAAGPSDIERAFQLERDGLKTAAITYIKQNPACTMEEVVGQITPLSQVINPATLIGIYITGAAQKGMIAAATWEDFRGFIAERTEEELMAI